MTLQFERAAVYEGAQIGVETTPGTAVPAIKRLLGCEIDFDSMTNIRPYRPQGNKFNTTSQRGKEWTSGRINGILCYNDLVYQASSWLQKATPSVPANNSAWLVTDGSGTIGFTFKGSTLAPSAWANAAAFQTAIGGMASVGVGNVKVTGTAPSYRIQFQGALSTDQSAITAAAGTPTPTIALEAAATLTNRWDFLMVPFGPDDVATYTLEKGASGIANMAQKAPFGFIHGMGMKFTKDEASLSGEFAAQITTDPFTMTTSSVVDIPCIPVDSAQVSVFMGTSLNNMVRMQRMLELEFNVNNRAAGLMTLNADDVSFSNRIESAPDLTSRFFIEHIAEGQAMLAHLRAGDQILTCVEATGPLIETGFPYRMRLLMNFELLKPNTAVVDEAYGKNYDAQLAYSSIIGGAIKLTVDSPLSTL